MAGMRLLLALLLLLPVACRAAELKLATWNLEWLTARPAGDPSLPSDAGPKRPDDIARLRRYAEILAADVISFQEVDGPAMAAAIFPPDRYAIHITADRVVQRNGLAISHAIPFTANPDLTGLDPYPNARYPLRSGADVTLHLPEGPLRILSVHLKTGCWEAPLTDTTGSSAERAACATLGTQLAVLQGWIAARRAEGVPFLLMGDFNRRMEPPDPFWAGLTRAAPLRRATAGHSSPCWGGERFIDHLIAGGPAIAWMEPDSLRVLVYRETDPAWKERLSDHCPVSIRLHVPD